MKITYNLGRGLGPILASLYIKIFVNYSYVTSNWGGVLTDFKVTIDFSKVGTLTTATDLNDGVEFQIKRYQLIQVNLLLVLAQ